jgi:tetratricopeptide (TPR) repeat protein
MQEAQAAQAGGSVKMNRMHRLPGARAALLAAAALCVVATAAGANPASEALRARASAHLYNLDHAEALDEFRQAAAADPEDAAAYRGLATSLWLSITFTRGNMTVDDYVGRVTKPGGPMPAPPAQTAAAYKDTIDKAIALARRRIAANPNDPDAHYQLGAAIGLRASYTATVEGSIVGAFRSAREAYDEHERVLTLEPRRKDAGLIVGTYRYIVATLALPLRWMAYVAGFGGGRERGLHLIEEAAVYRGENQTDARFALVLIYNREKRYGDALAQLAILRERYPRNRLVWLESGSTSLRAGRAADAERFLVEGMSRFDADHRERMFGESALWRYKRGAARVAMGRDADATADLRGALALEARKWVHGRTHLELGKLALKNGNKTAARQELQQAAMLADSDNDPGTAEEARRLMR